MTAAHAPHEADATIRREIGPRLPSAQLSPAGPAPAPSGPRVQRLLELQRAAGNQAVVQRLSNAGLIAQREPGDELAGAAPAPGGGGGGGGTEINDTSVKITAGSIELNAPMVRVGGVASTDTLIAESVVASNYTPGAGNVW